MVAALKLTLILSSLIPDTRFSILFGRRSKRQSKVKPKDDKKSKDKQKKDKKDKKDADNKEKEDDVVRQINNSRLVCPDWKG